MNLRSLVLTLILLSCAVSSGYARHHHTRSDNNAGQFDYYLLSLSWAPTYCLTHADDGGLARSEARAGGDYGLVRDRGWALEGGGG